MKEKEMLTAKTERLLEIQKELASKIPQLEKLEDKFWSAYRELFISSLQTTEAKREAEAKQILRNRPDNIHVDYYGLKVDVRVLLTEKEILIECCKNWRALLHGSQS